MSQLSMLLPARRAHALATRWTGCLGRRRSTTVASIAALLAREPRAPPTAAAVTVQAYVRSLRRQKRVAFAALGDGSTLHTAQAVLAPQLADGLSPGAAVVVSGRWTPSAGRAQSHELAVDSVRVLGTNEHSTSPLQNKYQTPEFLRSLPHLRPRLPAHALLLRLRSLVAARATAHFAHRGFLQCHPPIVTSSDCEGAGDVFAVTAPPVSLAPAAAPPDAFFGAPKFLTVSAQLHLEALALAVDRVWTLSPTFRAEKSDTARHLSEFYMLEAEMAFVDQLGPVMDVVEELLRAIATELRDSPVGRELLEARARQHDKDQLDAVSPEHLAQRWQGLVDRPWPRISYRDAVLHLSEAEAHGRAHFDFSPAHQSGLQTEHERFLASSIGRGGPVFVTDYPRSMKPFYMAPSAGSCASGENTVACFDLLVPDLCELVGGSLREHRLPELLEAMKARGLEHAAETSTAAAGGSLGWYADLRRYGSAPHGGFGLGFDRLLCYLSGVPNIRDVVSFPRWYKRCDC